LSEYVLGLSCFYHDSAAALLKDGQVIAACQEERLSRKKHDSAFPAKAVKYVLREAGIGPEQLDAVGFYDKPLLKFERMLSTYVATFPRSFSSFRKAMPLWMKERLWVPSLIRKDYGLILEAAAEGLVPMPLASLLRDRFVTLLARGGEALDWSAIARLSAADAGQEPPAP